MISKDTSKLLSTKYGKKGTILIFDGSKKDIFVNNFQQRKRERKERVVQIKKLREKKSKEKIKRDARQTMNEYIKILGQVCDSNNRFNLAVDQNKVEKLQDISKTIRYKGDSTKVDNCSPWNMTCSVKVTNSI